MNRIIGHQEILEYFNKIIENGNLSHAYCFVGQNHLGKRKVAEFIAAKILKIEIEKLATILDFTFVERLFDEKTEKTKKDITVEQIRNLREVLSRFSYLGGYKVAIIDEAERMNLEAANALLKTLEEPKDKTIIFLITSDDDRLPETILSRCQIINFFPIAKEELKNFLKEKNLTEQQASDLMSLSYSLPGLIINWLNDEEAFLFRKKEEERFNNLFCKPFYQKLNLVEEIFGDKTDHIGARDNLQNILNIWLINLRNKFFENKLTISRDKLVNLFDKIEEAKNLLEKNIHPRLLVEQILIEIP